MFFMVNAHRETATQSGYPGDCVIQDLQPPRPNVEYKSASTTGEHIQICLLVYNFPKKHVSTNSEAGADQDCM